MKAATEGPGKALAFSIEGAEGVTIGAGQQDGPDGAFAALAGFVAGEQ